MDRISDLPNEIIAHILSFLPTDEASSTSLLSKRWRNLFALSPNLQFSNDVWSPPQSFIGFVDRVLAVSGDSAIRSFTLNDRATESEWSDYTNRWIRDVLRRGTVLDLVLDTEIEYPLLFEVFACKTLVNLKLTDVTIPILPEDASLPALKSLHLCFVGFDHLGAFEMFISACPLLEELSCDQILEWSFINSALTLKRLTLTFFHNPSESNSQFGSLSFDYPNLVYLNHSGFIQRQYPVVNLGSLVEATIRLRDGDHDNTDPSDLIKGLRNVKILDLAEPETLKLFGIFREAVPVFEKLSHLSITFDAEYCSSVSALSFLLKKTPNIQTLVINGSLLKDCKCFLESSCLLSCPLKVLEVTEYFGSIKELEQMKRFLEKLPCLELVKVCAFAEDDEEKLKLTKDFLMLPRASKCKFQVEFS